MSEYSHRLSAWVLEDVVLVDEVFAQVRDAVLGDLREDQDGVRRRVVDADSTLDLLAVFGFEVKPGVDGLEVRGISGTRTFDGFTSVMTALLGWTLPGSWLVWTHQHGTSAVLCTFTTDEVQMDFSLSWNALTAPAHFESVRRCLPLDEVVNDVVAEGLRKRGFPSRR